MVYLSFGYESYRLYFFSYVQVGNRCNFPQQRTLCFCSWHCSFLFCQRPMETNEVRYDFVLGILYGLPDWHCNYRFLHCLCFSKSISECFEPLAEKFCARFYCSVYLHLPFKASKYVCAFLLCSNTILFIIKWLDELICSK